MDGRKNVRNRKQNGGSISFFDMLFRTHAPLNIFICICGGANFVRFSENNKNRAR